MNLLKNNKRYKVIFIEKSKPDDNKIEKKISINSARCIGFAVAGEIDGILISRELGKYILIYNNIKHLDDNKYNYTFLVFNLDRYLRIPKNYKVCIFKNKDQYIILQQHIIMKDVDLLWRYLFRKYKNIKNDKTFCVFKIFKKINKCF